MITRIANIFSYLFHPILMSLIGIFIIFNAGIYISDIPDEYKRFIYTIVFLCNVLIPLTLIPALYLLKNIQHITLNERRERLIPLFFSTICFYLGYYLVSRISTIRLIDIFLFSGVIVVMAIMIVSIFWKISIHMAGLGGITGLILMLSFTYTLDMTFFLALVVFISGIVASARLALHAHSPMQLIAGYLAGLLIVSGLLLQLMR